MRSLLAQTCPCTRVHSLLVSAASAVVCTRTILLVSSGTIYIDFVFPIHWMRHAPRNRFPSFVPLIIDPLFFPSLIDLGFFSDCDVPLLAFLLAQEFNIIKLDPEIRYVRFKLVTCSARRDDSKSAGRNFRSEQRNYIFVYHSRVTTEWRRSFVRNQPNCLIPNSCSERGYQKKSWNFGEHVKVTQKSAWPEDKINTQKLLKVQFRREDTFSAKYMNAMIIYDILW